MKLIIVKTSLAEQQLQKYINCCITVYSKCFGKLTFTSRVNYLIFNSIQGLVVRRVMNLLDAKSVSGCEAVVSVKMESVG